MMRRTFPRAVVLILLLAACAGETPAPRLEPSTRETKAAPQTMTSPSSSSSSSSNEPEGPDDLVEEPTSVEGLVSPDRFSKKFAMRHIRYLAGEVGARVRATRGELLAARFAAAKLRDFGYDVTIQKFSVDGATSRNVVASWPGSKRYPVVIGGHMDSVPGAPGANDNASGTAVVIELARVFRATAQARFTKFVLFGSEERGEDGRHHVGSEVYVKRLGSEGRNRLAGMVSIDMVADGRPLLIGNSAIAHDKVADALYRQANKRGVEVDRITLCDCSDHGSFELAGISAAFAYSGPTDYYHSAEDNLSKVKPQDVQRTGQAVKAFIKVFDGRYMSYLRRR